MKTLRKAKLIPHEEVFAKLMQDPEFAVEWKAQENERKITTMLIEERIKRRLTQRQLAEQIGVKQPSLARLETGKHTPTIAFLAKIADALGRRLEINLVPK